MTEREQKLYWTRHCQAKRIAENRCKTCCSPNFNGFQKCDKCREKNRRYQNEYRAIK